MNANCCILLYIFYTAKILANCFKTFILSCDNTLIKVVGLKFPQKKKKRKKSVNVKIESFEIN